MKPEILVAALGLWLALMAGPVQAASHVEQETRDIARLLRCPVCQNLSVADSQSQLAGQMRDLIRFRLEAGESREAILAYFVDRYGDEVLLDPPKSGFGQGVWLGAVTLLGLAVVVLGLQVRRWRSESEPVDSAPAGAEPLSAAEHSYYEAVLREELDRRGGRIS